MGAEWKHLFCRQDEGHDEAVEPQHLGENQDQDHAHEEPGLLSGASHARVAHDADGKPSCQAAQAHAQAGAKMQETPDGEKQIPKFLTLRHFLTQIHVNGNEALLTCKG